ncbi:MAG: rRNA maturation RNase YbeY [Clostridiales bacterium]|nr:rRNA maturation RNase YbeY [Clostridiales bacterium]
MTVDINNCQDKVDIDSEIMSFIENCILTGLKAEGIDFPVEVSILLVDDQQIRELNKAHRQIDSPTDVLSFPMLDFSFDNKEKDIAALGSIIERDGDAVVLGDIVLSMERAQLQAKEYNHSFLREVGFLLIHGLLHLMGYDHLEEHERMRMRQREEAILGLLNLSRSE